MNYSHYIFCKKDKDFSCYPVPKDSQLQDWITSSSNSTQLIEHISDPIVYYIYTKRISPDNDTFGICLKFNRTYFPKINNFFVLLDRAIETELIQAGKLLSLNADGNIYCIIESFQKSKIDIDRFFHFLKQIIRDNDFCDLSKLPEEDKKRLSYSTIGEASEYIINSIRKSGFSDTSTQETKTSNDVTTDKPITKKSLLTWLGCSAILPVISVVLFFIILPFNWYILYVMVPFVLMGIFVSYIYRHLKRQI
ncbi:MAG: hypothetical protein LBN06_04010 [Prevotellaceae bacterium]|nr:hypothetical protein [Prevotellaceae bacterium]